MEAEYVCSGAKVLCDKGSLPAVILASPKRVTYGGQQVCTVADKSPLINNLNFGVCAVTQQPCAGCAKPVKWMGFKSDFKVSGANALQTSSRLPCSVGGQITFLDSGQVVQPAAGVPSSKKPASSGKDRSTQIVSERTTSIADVGAEPTATEAVVSAQPGIATDKNFAAEDLPPNGDNHTGLLISRILFVNGHYQDNILGSILGSEKGGREYWSQAFVTRARQFFADLNPTDDRNFIDGSSTIGFDMSGADRYEAGQIYVSRELESLTEDFGPGESFKIITHSEGAAFGAGVANQLIHEGFSVSKVVHISADEGDEFTTPVEPQTIQIAYYGDWVTSNLRIEGVDKSGLVNTDLNWLQVHGYTRSPKIFKRLTDLISVRYRRQQEFLGNGSVRTYHYQLSGTTTHGTDFTHLNGLLMWEEDGSYKAK